MQTVGLWDRFEVAVENPRSYTDPYVDATLQVRYVKPDGSTISWWGFYDGSQTWKLRFMPDQVGTWHYRALFSDGAPGLEGDFQCIPSDLPGMLTADEQNPLWFGMRGGGHCLIRSLHIGDRFFAANFPAADRAAFLDWAVSQGYNMLSAASHYLNRREPDRGAGWDTPALWPLDAAEYQKLERLLDDLAARRMMVFPFAGFMGRGADFPRDPAAQDRYIRYVLARLGPYWNILLNVAGPEPLLHSKPYLSHAEIERLGRSIRDLDVFGHPLAVHNQTGDDAFRDEPWTSYSILQGPKTTDVGALYEGLLRSHHPRKPLYAQETLWSGNMHGHPDYTDDQLRRNALVIMMAAAALNLADNGGPIAGHVGNSSSGFSGSLALDQRRQWRHDIVKQVWDLIASFPFYRMRPRPDLVDAGFCLAAEGEMYLVYLPQGGAVTVHLDGGLYSAWWIDVKCDPDRRLPASTSRQNAQISLTAPDTRDWLLLLER